MDNNNISGVINEDDELESKKPWQRECLDWILSIAIAVALALIIRNYVFSLVNVSGSSMNPTLSDGDKLYVNMFMYKPEVGDIVILRPPQNPKIYYVKRVIATEGMTVNIDPLTHDVSVDGKVLDEPYITGKTTEIGGAVAYPYTVKAGEVFVLGDNRTKGGSADSRSIGLIPEENIKGKAVFRLYPFSHIGSIYEKQ